MKKVGYDLQWISCVNALSCRAGGSTLIGSHEGFANAVIATNYGGTTWKLVASNFVPNMAMCPTTLVCTGVFKEPTSVDTTIYFMRSTDGGHVWTQKAITHPLSAIACSGKDFCELVGLHGSLGKTIDSNLFMQVSPTIRNLNAVACPSVTACYAVGNTGTILARHN
jgi:hypothetical protein